MIVEELGESADFSSPEIGVNERRGVLYRGFVVVSQSAELKEPVEGSLALPTRSQNLHTCDRFRTLHDFDLKQWQWTQRFDPSSKRLSGISAMSAEEVQTAQKYVGTPQD